MAHPSASRNESEGGRGLTHTLTGDCANCRWPEGNPLKSEWSRGMNSLTTVACPPQGPWLEAQSQSLRVRGITGVLITGTKPTLTPPSLPLSLCRRGDSSSPFHSSLQENRAGWIWHACIAAPCWLELESCFRGKFSVLSISLYLHYITIGCFPYLWKTRRQAGLFLTYHSP